MKVIIVGAGPSGLLLALLLGKQGILVDVLEKSTTIDTQPRATHFSTPATYELDRAGVLDEMYSGGFVPSEVCWRSLEGTKLGGLKINDAFPKGYPHKLVCYPLDRLGPLLNKHVMNVSNVRVQWACNVVKVEQNASSAWVEAETPEGIQKFEADYVVGCDGARSIIRRQLFGDEFLGFTWFEQIVATNTYYDFDQFGWDDSNFIIDPEHYFMAARISPHRGKEALWRITYGELPGLTRDELLARQPEKFRKLLPGHPEPDAYEIVNFSPYKIHQRCAPSLRVGRVVLAADAAHLCNPFGGLGLVGGICDVGSLADCLIGIFRGVADDSILDHYDRVRRDIYYKTINPMSCENFMRVCRQTADHALRHDGFFDMCATARQDGELAEKAQLGLKQLLLHDFSQYFRKPEGA